MGIQARRAVAPKDVERCLKWLLDSEGPALLEVVTDKKVPVLPMVPGGKALHEFLIYDEGESLSVLPLDFTTRAYADGRCSERERKASDDEETVRTLIYFSFSSSCLMLHFSVQIGVLGRGV